MILEVLRIAEVLVVFFGGIVVYYALKSGRRSRSHSMLLLALGFAVVVIGAGTSGFLFELASADLAVAELVQAASQAAGFFIIVVSLLVSK